MSGSYHAKNHSVFASVGRSLFALCLLFGCATRSRAAQSWQDDCNHVPQTAVTAGRAASSPSLALRERSSSPLAVDTATASSFEGWRSLDRVGKASLFICSGDITVRKSGSADKVHLLLYTNMELTKPMTLGDFIQFFDNKEGQHRLYIKVPSSLKPKIEIEFPGDPSLDLMLRSGNLKLDGVGGNQNIRIEEGKLEIIGDIRQAYHYVALNLRRGQVRDCNHPHLAQKAANLWTVDGSGLHILVANIDRGQIFLKPRLNTAEFSCP
jgi:hypothetical protein